ncbi:hypothetical protein T09_6559 [Trichinella sp. T9]|nr:hypothetical protein T09_6559 [Trichinella sp. T9]
MSHMEQKIYIHLKYALVKRVGLNIRSSGSPDCLVSERQFRIQMRSKSFTTLDGKSSGFNSHYFNVCIKYQHLPFPLIQIKSVLSTYRVVTVFIHTIGTVYRNQSSSVST